jgi:Asp/Glu/hydantoin racemase
MTKMIEEVEEKTIESITVGTVIIELLEDEDTYGFGIEKDQEHAALFAQMMEVLMDDATRRGVDGLLVACRRHNRNILASEIEKFLASFDTNVVH